MKAFITGGAGFIGQYVVRKLILRGYDVYGLARSEKSATQLMRMGAHVVPGDINDRESMREAMTGSDVVFHLACWYDYCQQGRDQAETTNVAGTRSVLQLAHELAVPRIVHVSTVVVFGDTRGELVDETFFQGGPFLSEYDRTKWLAHYKVAMPLVEKGAPIITVMPGVAYGPGDTSWLADLMRLFYRGLMPAVPGPETTVTYAHVEDIAEGIVLAAEKGQIGESYILAGPAIPLGEMVDFWAHLTGKRAPALGIPARAMRPLAPVVGQLASAITLPSIFSDELTGLLGATYMARSDKARAELGWTARPLQVGMLETFEWIAATEPPGAGDREKRIALAALLAALLLVVAWLAGRRPKQLVASA
jgi:nucleoside-diphosphate-sugar epimerase